MIFFSLLGQKIIFSFLLHFFIKKKKRREEKKKYKETDIDKIRDALK